MPEMKLESPFSFGEHVIIDGDTSLVGVVTKIDFDSSQLCSIMISWVHNGAVAEAWVANWRLSPAPEK